MKFSIFFSFFNFLGVVCIKWWGYQCALIQKKESKFWQEVLNKEEQFREKDWINKMWWDMYGSIFVALYKRDVKGNKANSESEKMVIDRVA